MDLISIVNDAVKRAELNDSQLPEIFPDTRTEYSLSGFKGRALLNNICNNLGIRYLEIGSYAGSTFCSALYNNSIDATTVDIWERFIEQPRAGIVKNLFFERVKKYQGSNRIKIVEENIYDFATPEKIGTDYNVFFFDGDHTAQATEMAMIMTNSCMTKEFIFICDDYAMVTTRKGVADGISEMGYEVLYDKELGNVQPYDWYKNKADMSQPDWWCNYYIAVMRKTR